MEEWNEGEDGSQEITTWRDHQLCRKSSRDGGKQWTQCGYCSKTLHSSFPFFDSPVYVCTLCLVIALHESCVGKIKIDKRKKKEEPEKKLEENGEMNVEDTFPREESDKDATHPFARHCPGQLELSKGMAGVDVMFIGVLNQFGVAGPGNMVARGDVVAPKIPTHAFATAFRYLQMRHTNFRQVYVKAGDRYYTEDTNSGTGLPIPTLMCVDMSGKNEDSSGAEENGGEWERQANELAERLVNTTFAEVPRPSRVDPSRTISEIYPCGLGILSKQRDTELDGEGTGMMYSIVLLFNHTHGDMQSMNTLLRDYLYYLSVCAHFRSRSGKDQAAEGGVELANTASAKSLGNRCESATASLLDSFRESRNMQWDRGADEMSAWINQLPRLPAPPHVSALPPLEYRGKIVRNIIHGKAFLSEFGEVNAISAHCQLPTRESLIFSNENVVHGQADKRQQGGGEQQGVQERKKKAGEGHQSVIPTTVIASITIPGSVMKSIRAQAKTLNLTLHGPISAALAHTQLQLSVKYNMLQLSKLPPFEFTQAEMENEIHSDEDQKREESREPDGGYRKSQVDNFFTEEKKEGLVMEKELVDQNEKEILKAVPFITSVDLRRRVPVPDPTTVILPDHVASASAIIAHTIPVVCRTLGDDILLSPLTPRAFWMSAAGCSKAIKRRDIKEQFCPLAMMNAIPSWVTEKMLKSMLMKDEKRSLIFGNAGLFKPLRTKREDVYRRDIQKEQEREREKEYECDMGNKARKETRKDGKGKEKEGTRTKESTRESDESAHLNCEDMHHLIPLKVAQYWSQSHNLGSHVYPLAVGMTNGDLTVSLQACDRYVSRAQLVEFLQTFQEILSLQCEHLK